MYNRLLHYPPPPNVVPAKRPFPVAAVEAPVVVVEAAVVPAEENSPHVEFRPAHPDVALRAYYIFINEGAQHGSDVRHWLAAELQLLAEHKAA